MTLGHATREDDLSTMVRMAGWVTVELIHAASGVITRTLRFPNLLTDAGLNALRTNTASTMMLSGACGTSNQVPAVTDTALIAEIAPTATNRVNVASGTTGYTAGSSDFYWTKRVYLFPETKANGTLAEFGIYDTAGTTLWCRTLFKDGGGNPTTLTKTNTDQLRITYEYRLYPPTTDATGTITINGIDYTWTRRAVQVSVIGAGWSQAIFNYPASVNGLMAIDSNVLPARTTYDTGTNSAVETSHSDAAYIPGTFYRDRTYVFDPAIANFSGGIGRVSMGTASSAFYDLFQVAFAPKIPKDSTQRLTLTFRESWGRAP